MKPSREPNPPLEFVAEFCLFSVISFSFQKINARFCTDIILSYFSFQVKGSANIQRKIIPDTNRKNGRFFIFKTTNIFWEPLKTMRKSAVYEKFAKRERQNPYKSGN